MRGQGGVRDAVDDDLGARVGRMDAGQDLDQRRLARPVLADQAVHLAAPDRPFDPVERHRPAEPLAHAGEAEERWRLGAGVRSHRPRVRGAGADRSGIR